MLKSAVYGWLVHLSYHSRFVLDVSIAGRGDLFGV